MFARPAEDPVLKRFRAALDELHVGNTVESRPTLGAAGSGIRLPELTCSALAKISAGELGTKRRAPK